MTTRFYSIVDDVLGDRRSRYFGEGYVKSKQSIGDFTIVDRGETISFSCVGRVDLPNTWSEKGEDAQTPHLSTIDVLELVQLCVDAFLIKTFHSSRQPCFAIEDLAITAGSAPVEGCLSTIPISGSVLAEGDLSGSVRLEIANMVVTASLRPHGHIKDPVDHQLKSAISVKNLMLDRSAMAAAALLAPDLPDPSRDWDISTCFAAALQLGQVVLYELDEIARAESNTLWMKRTSIHRQHAQPTRELDQPIFAWIENSRRYHKSDGEWRRAEICGLVAGTKIVCSVTHKLPERIWIPAQLSVA